MTPGIPDTMLQPADISDDEGGELRRVVLRPVDEAEDTWDDPPH